ncbi:uncharacterized protein A1O9_07233 [Exophiala aquamarina CBS 119918]|uniref:Kelch repeat-containing protein n=1 Tax=Exophiala aquamarina CBS 119918 TaxID=1182545 RepID=A0A072PCL5_9EURO|nr:uncharacterized protein A1O9_07233 [Exophiala aquamarina CBS 119918]KEF57043.1 hypothetical protein A1O9_07233 [Exophiala aquamarina CBS 119918]
MPVIAGDHVWIFTVSNPLYDKPDGANYELGQPNTGYAPESENFLPRTNGAGANAPSENLGFYLGGMWNANGATYTSTDYPTNRSTDLIKVNTVNQGHADWQIYPFDESIVPWRAEGGLVWLPTSSQGVLVVIGGVTAPEDLGFIGNETDESTSLNFLKEFPVYDIGSNTWAMQAMDSSSPFPDKPLAQFCTVVASTADGSHHDIFVYGGGNGEIGVPTGDVWVLSVPSFTWIKAESNDRLPGDRPGIPRLGHVCTSPYPNQMIVIGGTSTGGSPLKANQSIDVYNLNSLNWTGAYDPDSHEDYKPHQNILDVISKKPKADNISPQVGDWFDQKYNMDKIRFYGPYAQQVSEPPPASNNTGQGNATAPTPPTPPVDEHQSNRHWVIPVAVAVPIGSVAVLIGLLLLLLRRKRRLERQDRERETSEDNTNRWIVPWIWAIHPQHKEAGSDTVTEVEQVPKSPPKSPPPQELPASQRDGYFTPSDTGVSSNQRWSSTTPARSPLGEYTGPVEGPDNPIHEIEGRHQHLASDEINYDPKNMAAHPPSIVSGRHRGYSGDALPGSPDTYHLSGPLETNAPITTNSSRALVVFPEGEYAHQTGFGPLDHAVSPLVSRQNQPPRHRHHNSSVSSGMSLPSPDLEQSPRTMPRVSRSLSGEHDSTSPGSDFQENGQGNQTY